MTTQRQDGAMLDEQPMNTIDMDDSAAREPGIASERLDPPPERGKPRKTRRDSSQAGPADAASGEPSDPVEIPCSDLPLASRIEAILTSADRPMADARLASLLGLTGKGTLAAIRDAVDALNSQFEQDHRCYKIEKLAGGYQILTKPEFAPLVSQFHREREDSRLSNAALETLAIIAYRQPMLRVQIEAIRGVAAGEVLRGLLERRLIKIVGRAEELGRPMLYGTTGEFLRVFGLAGLDDLPEVDGLKREPAATLNRPRESAPSPPSQPQSEAGESAA